VWARQKEVLRTHRSEESTHDRGNDLCEAVAQHGTGADLCDGRFLVGMEWFSWRGRERSVSVGGFGCWCPEGMRFGVENVIIKTDVVWVVERQVQVFQHLGIPEALGDIDARNIIWFGDIPDSSITSSRDLQVLIEICESTGSTVLIFLVASRSPGDEV